MAKILIKNRSQIIFIIFIVIHIKFCLSINTYKTNFTQNITEINDNNQLNTICYNMDIRNNLNAFKKLQSCGTIEGFLKIVLTDFSLEAYQNITLPNLLSISGYLLIYHVSGLKTLSYLFPNLTVIRGELLIFGYSLIIYDVPHLQEIGLFSLKVISKGSVYIDRNPSLCFANTINWQKIIQNDINTIHIKQKSDNECPTCSKYLNDSNPECLILKNNNSNIVKSYCWNSEKCQKVCPDYCGNRGCMGNKCCHSSCLGSCNGPTNKNCLICKNLLLPSSNICISICPNGTYNFLNTRCVTATECYNILKLHDGKKNIRKKPYIPFKDLCSDTCPLNFQEFLLPNQQYTCISCNGSCRKECNGGVINKIDDSNQYYRCTIITGFLEIKIRSGNKVFEILEKNLGFIETINGYLTIARSFSLKSLMFLRNLKEIKGESLSNDLYGLVVYDNQNLEELWVNLTGFILKNGSVFFHFNPKLCLHKIQKFIHTIKINISEITALNISPNTNGDKITCSVLELNVSIKKLTSTSLKIEWIYFEARDYRNLFGYRIYFIETNNKNVSILDSRDPCNNNQWKIEDVLSTHKTAPNKTIEYTLKNLKPFTQYAFYVTTYTLSNEEKGAQSSLIYFQTRPDKPSEVQHLKIMSSPNELFIDWKLPRFPNGNVTHYVISVDLQEESSYNLNQRDYCIEPLTLLPITNDEEIHNGNYTIKDDEYKNDSEANRKIIINENEHYFEIDFENELHNSVFIKRKTKNRFKKSIFEQTSSNVNKDNVHHYYLVYNKTSFIVSNLCHYSKYLVTIQACRSRIDQFDTANNNCSEKITQTIRTKKQPDLDNVTFSEIRVELNVDLNKIILFWDEPNKTNGYIVAYQIEYKNMDFDQIKPVIECIPRQLFLKNNNSYTIKQLAPGNYRIRILTTTIAGNGFYSEYKYFYVGYLINIKRILFIFVSITVIILFILICFYWSIRRHLSMNLNNTELRVLVNTNYTPIVYIPDEWEINRNDIQFIRELGKGNFGIVHEGILKSSLTNYEEVRCAIKRVRENSDYLQKKEILNEASIMKKFDCYHVVKLLGIVSTSEPILVVMELMTYGDLKNFLINKQKIGYLHKKDPLKPVDRIYRMAIEIADGMAYLSSNRFIHRDLSARNCMVSSSFCVKIGDFGFSRDIYEEDYYHKDNKNLLPIRWMAPESLLKGTYSYASDVWSYGIVIWEIITSGNLPYTGLSNQLVIENVLNGGLLPKPIECPNDSFYNLMMLTWNYNPSDRPTFFEIVHLLLPFVSSDFSNISFYHKFIVKNNNFSEIRSKFNLNNAIILSHSLDNLVKDDNNNSNGIVQFFERIKLFQGSLLL